MNRLLLGVLAISLAFSSCKKSSTADPGSSCSILSNFTAVQQGDQLKFSYTNSGTPAYYELSVALTAQPENGYRFNLGSGTTTKSLDSLGVNFDPGTPLLIYLRAICDNGAAGDWIGPKSITLASYC